MASRNARSFALLTLIACLAAMAVPAPAAWAGKLEFTFTKPDTETWELTGLAAADFKEDGLHFSWPAGEGRKPRVIMMKKMFKDDLLAQAEFTRVKGPPLETQVVLIFDNPQQKRRAEMMTRATAGKEGTIHPYGAISYFKDGHSVGRMAAWRWEAAPADGLRLRKIAKRVYGAFPGRHGSGLVGWIAPNYPRTDFDEDCDEFRVGFMVIPPAKGAPVHVVLKKLTVSGPQTGGSDLDERQVYRFDFGPPNQEIAADYIPVSQYTAYTDKRGYGWKTDLTPRKRSDLKRFNNEELKALGYPQSFADEGWRRNADQTLLWTQHVQLRPILSTRYGWDRIAAIGKTLDLKLPQEKDSVFAVRHYGFPHDYRIEADQWEKRGAIYVDDDLSTEFRVDVPNGRYHLLMGIGFTVPGPYHHAPVYFSIDAEGRTVKKDLHQNWEKCGRVVVKDVEVEDGQLNLRFFANRRLSMNEVAPYNLACGWLINYMLVIPGDDPELFNAEEWRLIQERSKRVRQVVFEPGDPAVVQRRNGYMHVNGKPYLPVVLQYGYAWPRSYYHLYTWANCYTEGMAASEIQGSLAFFKHDWERYSHWDNYPWRAIASMNNAIRHGNLSFIYVENYINIVPKAIQGEGGTLKDHRGRANRWRVQPPLGSRLNMEIIKEAYTMTSNQLKFHPANPGFYVYEEIVHPFNYGYDHNSLGRYRDLLRGRYPNIDALNREWGREYKGFDEVKPPKRDWTETPEWRNFFKFRRWSMELAVGKACEMVNSLEPQHCTMGQKCKPDAVSSSWGMANAVDLFGGGGPPPFFGAAAKNFSRALTQCPGYWDCPWAWCDGRRQLDHKPKKKRYLGRFLLPVYNNTVSLYFQGVKGFWTEEYNDGVRHMFHRTTLIKRDSERGKIKTWFGDIVFFDKEALDLAPVTACLTPLRFSRAVQLGYRLGPLFLPAKTPRGSVAALMTEDSYLVRTGAAGGHRGFVPFDTLMKTINVPYDLVRPENIEELKNYDIVVLAGWTQTVGPEVVTALTEHVRRGGKVLLLDHALGWDARTLVPVKVGPAYGFHELAGLTYRYERWPRGEQKEPAAVTDASFFRSVKAGDTVRPHPYFKVTNTLVPAEGSTVFAKIGEKPVGVINKQQNVVTLSLPWLCINWQGAVPLDATFVALVRDTLEKWNVRRPIEQKGEPDPKIELRYLTGDGYWLLAVFNRNEEDKSVAFTGDFLGRGDYEIVDVTGERPLIVKNEKKELHLVVDNEYRPSRFVARNISAEAFAKDGLTLKVDGIMARVLLVRPAGEPVWVNAPEQSLRAVADRAKIVVVGDTATPQETAAARKLVEAMKSLGQDVELKKASEIRIEKTRNEVRVSPTGKGKPRRRDSTYLVNVFENQPLDVDTNVVLVGRADTNALMRHLQTPNTFTYDKVLEKVTPEYPGTGRGLIEMVECVNRPAYDTSSFSRDAIVVAGSDDAGTARAVDRFIEIMKKDRAKDAAVSAK